MVVTKEKIKIMLLACKYMMMCEKLGYSANGKNMYKKGKKEKPKISSRMCPSTATTDEDIIFGLLAISAVAHIPCGPSQQHTTAPSIRPESRLNDHNCTNI